MTLDHTRCAGNKNRTVYEGGVILPLAGQTCWVGYDSKAEAVLTEGSTILAVGSKSDALAWKDSRTRVVSLKGNTLIPGFVDGHSHITSFSETQRLVSLSGVESFQELEDRLRQFKKEHGIPDGEWISGFGYDQNFMEEKRHPTREVLDRAVPENPVLISHASGHMGVMNSLALKKAGLRSDTPDPEGGKFGRRNGELTGFMEETAFTSRTGIVPKPSKKERQQMLLEAERVYFSYGITTIQDGLTQDSEWELLEGMAREGLLTADIVCYPDEKNCPSLLTSHSNWTGHYHDHLKIGGWKIFLDGSPQGRTAWMRDPYLPSGDPDSGEGACYRGYPVYSDSQVEAFILKSLEHGVQLLAHCNGDAAAEQYISCFERCLKIIPRPVRPVMIHAQLVRKDQLRRMARIGMMASFFAAHTYYWGDIHIKNLGLERAMGISPLCSALRNGVKFTLHQDTPVILPNMMETLWCAVNRTTRNNRALELCERISPLQALLAMTVHGAYQYFEENTKGCILPGYQADFAILDRNPLETPLQDLNSVRVLETVKDGKTVYQRD